MPDTSCPICKTEADGGHHLGDTTVFICPQCGGYRLTENAIVELQNSTLPTPKPSEFAALVSQRRNESEAPEEYPKITTDDLRALTWPKGSL